MLHGRDYTNMEDDDLTKAIFELAPDVDAKMVREAHKRGMVREAHKRGLESELKDIFNRLGDDSSEYYTPSQETFATKMRSVFPNNQKYNFISARDSEDASEQPDDGLAEQLQESAAIADDEASESEKEEVAQESEQASLQSVGTLEQEAEPMLFLYEHPSKTQAKHQEITNQSYVNNRFFRMIAGKGMKDGSDSKKIYDILVALPSFDSTYLLENKKTKYKPTNYGNWIPAAKRLVQACLNARKIPLDNYSSRSVIISLTKYLEKHGHMPTVVYTIGNTHILCISNPTIDQPGNVNLQTISNGGDVVFSDTIYGNKVSDRLKELASDHEKDDEETHEAMRRMYGEMRQNSRKIGTLGDSPFLDQINFLRAVIEVARYSCGEHLSNIDNTSPLRKFPIGVAQMRTSQLLIDDEITTDEAYGVDTSETYYKGTLRVYSGVAEKKDVHKAPFGVVTGKDIKGNLTEVQCKIERINDKYHDVYHAAFASATPTPGYMISGNSLLRKKLGEEFGSGDESSHGDYSDEGVSVWNDKDTLQKVRYR